MGKRLNLDQAVQRLNEHFKYDPGPDQPNFVEKHTIYNSFHKEKLKNYGRPGLALVDEDELIALAKTWTKFKNGSKAG